MKYGMVMQPCASENKIDREAQEAFGKRSYERAQKAIDTGLFAEEIVPVEIPQHKGDPVVVDTNEEPGRVKFDRIPILHPAFEKDGSVTAANASSINDGAGAVVLMCADEAAKPNLKRLARIVSQASAAQAREGFTTAPAKTVAAALWGS